jgi:adenylosuccinate synthase
VAASLVRRALGITKAYATRVGSGPFPSELHDLIGEKLRHDGDEYGSTTGRPRRCGWFDAVVVRHAARLSGLDGLAVTKLDVLRGFDTIRICVAYRSGSETIDHVPASGARLARVEPMYEELPGWTEEIAGARRLEDLPANARRYLDRLAVLTGVPVRMVSVGARREETIVVTDPFA